MTRLYELAQLGQATWYDYIRRCAGYVEYPFENIESYVKNNMLSPRTGHFCDRAEKPTVPLPKGIEEGTRPMG